MKKLFMVPVACLVLAGGCASSGQMRRAESTGEANQKALREADHRLRVLEQNVAVLDRQVAQLNNRAYEVRTRAGQKTGMTVVPILPPQPVATKNAVSVAADPQSVAGARVSPGLASHGPEAEPTPGQQARQASLPSAPAGVAPAVVASNAAAPAAVSTPEAVAQAPQGRMIDPAAPARPFPTESKTETPPPVAGKARAAVSGGRSAPALPQREAQPQGSDPAPLPSGSLALPLETVPAATPAPPPDAVGHAAQSAAPVPSGIGGRAGGDANVPVPPLPPSSLALPPEHPGLPPLDAGSAAPPASAAPASPDAKPSALAVPVLPVAPSAQAPGTRNSGKQTSGKGEEAAYKAALQVVLSGRSAEGVERFQAFLQAYPQGRYAANAEYWTGEAFYAQGRYREALAQFQKVDAAYDSHHKNADALLKTGMCLSRLGDKEGADQAYKKLLARFPQSEAAGMVRSRGMAR